MLQYNLGSSISGALIPFLKSFVFVFVFFITVGRSVKQTIRLIFINFKQVNLA